MNEKQLEGHLRKQRRNVVLLSVIFHTVAFAIFFLIGMMGSVWMLFFIPAATMVIRGVRTTKGIYKLFGDPTKAQKYYSQARS